MSTKSRIKMMRLEEFEQVMQRTWSPVKLEDDAIPSWLRGIPRDVLHSVYASGTSSVGSPLAHYTIPSGELIGGIDVYRRAPDDPYELNKDWYAVISIPDSDGMLLIQGPISDSEHWLNEIPKRLHGAEVLAVPPKDPQHDPYLALREAAVDEEEPSDDRLDRPSSEFRQGRTST